MESETKPSQASSYRNSSYFNRFYEILPDELIGSIRISDCNCFICNSNINDYDHFADIEIASLPRPATICENCLIENKFLEITDKAYLYAKKKNHFNSTNRWVLVSGFKNIERAHADNTAN